MSTKYKKLAKETDNRSVYNKAIKIVRDHNREIHCSYCKYHRGENTSTRYYAYTEYEVDDMRANTYYNRRPSWKLATKNRKQWMNKDYEVRREYSRYYKIYYYEIVI